MTDIRGLKLCQDDAEKHKIKYINHKKLKR
jgi:hypothetical protein